MAKAQPGRKKEIETEGFRYLQVRMPVELEEALRRFLFDHPENKKATYVRELLEKELERAGYIKVTITRDGAGREVRSYKVLER